MISMTFLSVIPHPDAGSRKENIGLVTGFPLRRGNDNFPQPCELLLLHIGNTPVTTPLWIGGVRSREIGRILPLGLRGE